MTTPKIKSIDELRKWLQPTEYLSPGNELKKHLSSYVPGTGDWLRQHEEFCEWKDGDRGCLWIKGLPGSGKSVFAASTITKLAENSQPELSRTPILYFFFRQIVERNHDPKYLVRDWASQLLPYSTTLQQDLSILSAEDVIDNVDVSSMWAIILTALKAVNKVYCVADALDEMDDQHASFIQKLKELGSLRPDTIKVLLTSRPIPKIEDLLRDTTTSVLRLETSHLYPDIEQFVKTHLLLLEPSLSLEKDKLVREAICGRSNGLFLYARLTMDSLIEGLRNKTINEHELPTSLAELPLNLKDLYTRMLAEHSIRSDTSQDQQLTIIQCVTQSARPLRVIELGSIIALLKGDANYNLSDGKRLVKAACGRLLEILEDESVSVIHHSFTEFVRDSSRTADVGGFPVLEEHEAHKLMVQVCLSYLDACDLPDNITIPASFEGDEAYDSYVYAETHPRVLFDRYDTQAGRSEAEGIKRAAVQQLRYKHPLLDYATENLIYHIKRSDSTDSNLHCILEQYLFSGSTALEIWLLMRWGNYRRWDVHELHVASNSGLTQYAQWLVATGAAVDVEDGEGYTPLMYAVENGHTEIAAFLLSCGAKLDTNNHDGYSPLHLATSNGHVESVKLLLSAGLPPTIKKSHCTPEWVLEMFDDDSDTTPLQSACEKGNAELISLFIDYMDHDAACRCLFWSVRSKKVEAVEAVLKTGKVVVDILVDGRTALTIAASELDFETVRVLLQYGANPNMRVEKNEYSYTTETASSKITFKPKTDDGPTAMHFLAGFHQESKIFGKTEAAEQCLKYLIDAGGRINEVALGGHTPLHYACKKRNSLWDDNWQKDEVILSKLFLQYGADPALKCQSGDTPFHKMTPHQPDLVDILIRGGADINATNNKGLTPLMEVIRRSTTASKMVQKAADQLIQRMIHQGASVTAESNGFHTVLHLMFSRLGEDRFSNSLVWETVLNAGADLNRPNSKGKPPMLCLNEGIHRSRKAKEILQHLMKLGLDVNCVDSKNRTILYALFDQYKPPLESFQMFVDFGTVVSTTDIKGMNILQYGISKHVTPRIFRFLLESGVDPMTVDKQHNTLLHSLALFNPGRQVAEMYSNLIGLGISAHEKNALGQTALHIAAGTPFCEGDDYNKPIDVLCLILSNDSLRTGANIDLPDNSGATALHYAACVSERFVKHLIQKGANVNLKSGGGFTALHIAARSRKSNVIGFLLSELRDRNCLAHSLEAKDSSGRTALFYACRSGYPESIEYLVQAGADGMVVDKKGRTPLHAMAEYRDECQLWNLEPVWNSVGQPGAAGFSLEDRRRPRDKEGVSLMGFRAIKDAIDMLETAGVDLRAVDHEGNSAMDLAIETNFLGMAEELNKRGLLGRIPRPFSWRTPEQTLAMATVLLARRELSTGNKDPKTAALQKRHDARRFREILQTGDLDLFIAFSRVGADITISDTFHTLSGLHALVECGFTDLLELFDEDIKQFESRMWAKEEHEVNSLLCHACSQSLPRLSVIKLLIHKLGVDMKSPRQYIAAQRLARGTYFWNIEALGYLLDNGCDLEGDNKSNSLLMEAVSQHKGRSWSVNIIHLLLEHGANPNILNKAGTGLLSMLQDANLIRLLAKYGADTSLGNPLPLITAVRAWNTDAVRALLESGADANEGFALYEAAKPCEDHEYNNEGERRRIKQEAIISLLIKHGANPFLSHVENTTILQALIEQHAILEELLSLPIPNIDQPGKDGRTFLISACYPAITPAPRSYVERSNPLLPVCASPVAISLMKKGANVNIRDNMGRTALHWICTLPKELDEIEQLLFKTLVELSPNLWKGPDSKGFTPLQLALSGAHVNGAHVHLWIPSFLISLGADPSVIDPEGNHALHHLARKLVGARLRALQAAEHFNYFLSLGLDINHRNELGETPLFCFISTSWKGTKDCHGNLIHTMRTETEKDIDHVTALSIFLENNADLQTINIQGETLLHATAKRNSSAHYVELDQRHDMERTFRELLTRKVDPMVEDKEHRTALDVAVACQQTFLVDLFSPEVRSTE